MRARELLVERERRIVALQVLLDAGGDQLVLDRGEPRRLLRVAGAHVVLQAVGVGDERGGHWMGALRTHYLPENHSAFR